MSKGPKSRNEPSDAAVETTATEKLSEAARALSDAAVQMTQGLHALQRTLQSMAPTLAATAAATGQINAWEDDPFSEETPTADPVDAVPIQVALPVNENNLLQIQVNGPSSAPGIYPAGTSDFRYWTAIEALTRGVNFWGQWLPVGTRWTTTEAPMRVTLVAGEDLNANYSRWAGLRFYQKTVKGRQFFSGESPDVACHELGHAVLDALRPELFDAANTETAAFHEFFGDMSAILSALQIDSLCQKVIKETGGRLNVNSRLSRLAEQLGWAIRQLSPTAVDRDCLRNAANRFFYQNPDDIPPSAPASQISSEVHSFSRVFTGAFLDALSRMLDVVGAANTNNLRTVSGHLGQLLVDGVHLAPINASYFSQVAAAMIQANKTRFGDRYGTALRSAFLEHGVLEPSTIQGLAQAPVPQQASVSVQPMAVAHAAAPPSAPTTLTMGSGMESDGYLCNAQDAPELPTLSLQVPYLNLALVVHSSSESTRFQVSSAALEVTEASPITGERAAQAFVEDLIQLGRIDFEPAREAIDSELLATYNRTSSMKTHTLVVGQDKKVSL